MANLLYRTTDVADVRTQSSVKNSELEYHELDSNFILINEHLDDLAQDISTLESTTANSFKAVSLKQTVSTLYTANADITATIPLDNTKPQKTEGTEIASLSITPIDKDSTLFLEFNGTVISEAVGNVVISVFQNSGTDAVYATAINIAADELTAISFKFRVAAVNVTTKNFSVRVGTNDTNKIRFNGAIDGSLFNGAMATMFQVTEIK